MLDINQMLVEKAASSGDGNLASYSPVTTYEELKSIIKSGTI